MFKTINFSIWPKNIDFLEKIKIIVTRIKREYGLVNASYGERKWDNNFHVYIDSYESYTCDSEKEFYQVLQVHNNFSRFIFHLCMRKRSGISRYGLGIDFNGSEWRSKLILRN
jgi:hypothetical protein